MLATTLGRIALSQRDLARETGQSLAAINAIVSKGEWPKRRTAAVRASVVDALRNAGATTTELRQVSLAAAAPENEMAPSALTPEAASTPAEVNQNPTEKEEPMLLQNTPITPQALKHYNLPRSPFVDDVQSRDDVYQSPAVRYARAALLDAASNHGFVALVGESGAGKTTLVEELEQRLIDEGKDIVVIKPYVLAMEATDTKGKTLRATHIAEAIAYALDPQLKIKRSPQTRFAQLHQLLVGSRRAGRRHLLVIEEERLVGILSDKDLYKALSPFLGSGSENQRDRDTLQRRVHQVMTREPITISPQGSITEASELLLTHAISCLPVLENGQVVGIVTWRDLLRSCYEHQMAEISHGDRKS